MNKDKLYTITCTEEQLRFISYAVEDWHRFLAGQCEMDYATSYIEPTDAMHECREILRKQIHPLVTPLLSLNSSYGWDGSTCPNKAQKKAIAMSYGIYREIKHYFATQNPNGWDVYQSETLTCPDTGTLIKIKELW